VSPIKHAKAEWKCRLLPGRLKSACHPTVAGEAETGYPALVTGVGENAGRQVAQLDAPVLQALLLKHY